MRKGSVDFFTFANFVLFPDVDLEAEALLTDLSLRLTVDRSLVTSFLSTTFTYWVILVQFAQTVKSS